MLAVRSRPSTHTVALGALQLLLNEIRAVGPYPSAAFTAARVSRRVVGYSMTTKGRADIREAQDRGEADEADRLRGPDPHSDTHEIAPSSRVLVVDDEPLLLKTFQRLLGREHAVTVSSTATEALERIAAGERFDVIVCDLMMPRVSGMDFYESLQQVDADAAARMVFVTGGAFTQETREFLRKVPNERIEKPWNADELRALVRRLAGRER